MKATSRGGQSLSRIMAAVLLFSLSIFPAILPSAAHAQQWYGSYGYQASTTSYMSQDGSAESREARRERIRSYRQQSNELQQKISALGSTAVSSVKIPVLFGVGVSSISPNFGDPRGNGTRTHEGEDIMAVKGTPIVSPTAAVVLRTGVGETEGNYVYTANPGGETFVYMHLDRIGEGVTSGAVIAAGGLIGYNGNTGNASGGAAHLHFEIHDSSNNPVDPFPRLTSEFALQEKIQALSIILTQNADAAFSQFLVLNFRNTFTVAAASGIPLPQQITAALAAIPASASTGNATTVAVLPAGDLDVGSSGAAVVALQKYLIQANVGTSARALATAGATGYYGAMTKAAVAEFQFMAGVSPNNGYYGAATRAYVLAHPIAAAPIAVTPASPSVTSPTAAAASGNSQASAPLTRDLKQGMTGDDVRTLQRILNARGFTVAASGAGSVGNETMLFGPATASAVIRFQQSKGIVPAAGYVGSITRAAFSTL